MLRALFGLVWLRTVLGILWLVLFIWALLDILGSRKSGGEKALWIIACLILPVLGVLIYALFGREEAPPPATV